MSSEEFETKGFRKAFTKFTWWLNPRMHACSKEEEDVLEKLEEEKINNSYLTTKAWEYGGTETWR